MPVPFLLAAASAAPALVDMGIRIADRMQDSSGAGGAAGATGAPSGSSSTRRPPPSSRYAGRPAPGRSPSTTSSPSTTGGRPAGPPALDAEQRASLQAIAAEVRAAALPAALAASRPALLLALVVNAHAESRLRPRARNQTGREDSVGLFQANRRGGLGQGYSVAQLSDPRFNTRLVLREVVRQGDAFEALLTSGATLAQLTAAFTLWVERPAAPRRRSQERAEAIARWFPMHARSVAYRWGS